MSSNEILVVTLLSIVNSLLMLLSFLLRFRGNIRSDRLFRLLDTTIPASCFYHWQKQQSTIVVSLSGFV